VPRSSASTHVVVVGGGIAGAAALWHLAEHVPAVLVEREPSAGSHATGRSASVLNVTSGHPVVGALAETSRRFLQSPPDGFCPGPLLAPRGLIWVGEASDADALDSLVDQARGLTADVRRLTADEVLLKLAGFRRRAVAGGGVHEPGAMAIDTALLLQSFLAGARRRGAIVLTSSEAVSADRIDDGESRWAVHIGERVITCRHLVDAAGAWGDVLAARCGVAPLGLLPTRRTAALVPAPAAVAAWPLVMDVAGRYYLEPEAGGLLVSPADETPSEPGDARPEELDVALALERVAEATGLTLRTVRTAWAGLRTFAPDRLPVVGEDPDAPGFWWLVGQGGAGIKTSPALGAMLADAITGSASTPPVTPALLAPARLRS
jgi:D-arginine dehydrogenase